MSSMLDQEKKIVRFTSFENSGLVHHGVSTRRGGVSQGPFSSMNLSFTRGDDPVAVKENFARFCRTVGVDENSLVFSDQVHEDRVVFVGKEDVGKGFIRESDIRGVDGLTTNVPGVTLVTFYADCVPLFFLDPVHKAIALSHAGWKGTLKKMGLKTLEEMNSLYGTRPEDVLVGIGPSIGPCCYEVSEEIIKAFESAMSARGSDLLAPGSGQRAKRSDPLALGRMLNLQAANEMPLIEAGVPEDNIEISGLCTRCNNDLFHSHRAQGATRGSLAAMLSLKEVTIDGQE